VQKEQFADGRKTMIQRRKENRDTGADQKKKGPPLQKSICRVRQGSPHAGPRPKRKGGTEINTGGE